MSRSRDPFQIPKAGLEVAPLAGLASINLNGSVGPVSGTEFVSESTLGGVLVYAIYQALLTALRTEAMRQRGVIDRTTVFSSAIRVMCTSIPEGSLTWTVRVISMLAASPVILDWPE